MRELLAAEGEHVRRGDDGDVAHGEDPEVCRGGDVAQDDGDGDEGPEDVDGVGDRVGGAPDDAEEVGGFEAGAAGFAFAVGWRGC